MPRFVQTKDSKLLPLFPKGCGDFKREEWAHARRTDPDTSHDAAASMRAETLSRFRSEVLDTVRRYGPMHDGDLVDIMLSRFGKRSPSGCRTRRKELVDMGLVEDTGQRMKLPSGRQAILWRATDPARQSDDGQ